MTVNVVSMVMQASTNGAPEPYVGMGVTFIHYSDRSAGTVTGVRRFKSGARKGRVSAITVQGDDSFVYSGSAHDGSAAYGFRVNLRKGGPEYRVNLRGQFSRKGQFLAIGFRDEYRDPSF